MANRPDGAAGGGNPKTFCLVCFKLSKATFRVTCRELGGLVIGADTQRDLSWAVLGLCRGAEGTDDNYPGDNNPASLVYDLWSPSTKRKAAALLEVLTKMKENDANGIQGIQGIPGTEMSQDASKYCSYFVKVLSVCLNDTIHRGFMLGWAVVKDQQIVMLPISVGSQSHLFALPKQHGGNDYNSAMQDVCFGLQGLLYRCYGISVNVWDPLAVVRCGDINARALSNVQGINLVVRTKGMRTFDKDDAYLSNHILEYCTDIPKDLRELLMPGETEHDTRQTSYFAVPQFT